MRKVHLHGALGEKYGKCFELEVTTTADAVRALYANFPGIVVDLRDHDWHIVRGDDIETGMSLGDEEIASFQLGRGDLHFVPLVAGSKSTSGTLKIVLGGLLIGVSLFMGFGAPLALGGFQIAGLTYGNVAMIGAGLALSGVSQLLAPEEKSDEDRDSSFTFSGPGNTYEQGAPVPLVYGRVITGGVMISGGIDIEKIAVGA